MNNINTQMLDEAISLAQTLVQAPSISPSDGGTHEIIAKYLADLGFSIEHMNISETKNIYAKIGRGPYLCFAGHTDVVPPGPNWKHPPYSGIIENPGCNDKTEVSQQMLTKICQETCCEDSSAEHSDGSQRNVNKLLCNEFASSPDTEQNKNNRIYGRGTNDMKTTIACAMVVFKYLLQKTPDLSLAMLLTSDEEAAAEHGLKQITPQLIARGEPIKLFVLGEPTASTIAGDTVKIGRRGSVTAIANIFGIQGHIAYPQLANNPIPVALKIANELANLDFADDHPHFGKTCLQLTNIDAKNLTMNMTPAAVEMRFGIRFHADHKGRSTSNTRSNANIHVYQTPEFIADKITSIFEKHCEQGQCSYEIDWKVNGYPFICDDLSLLHKLEAIINPILQRVSAKDVIFDAKGATSDGRFLSQLARTIEIGFPEEMAHKADEYVKISDIKIILEIYYQLFFELDF